MIPKIIFVALLLVFQQSEVPIFEGDEDPSHNGQPQWCQARDENGFKKNCGICDRRCGEDHNSPNCKVYCRKSACRCHPECSVTGHRR